MESFFEKDLTNDVQMYIMYIDNKHNKGDKMKIYKIKDKGKEIFIQSTLNVDYMKKFIVREKKQRAKDEKSSGYKMEPIHARDIQYKYGHDQFGIIDVIETDIEI